MPSRYYPSEVDAAKVRALVERSRLPLNQLCLRLGWIKGGRSREYGGDVERLKRALNKETMRQATAKVIVEALGYDPVDADF